MYVTSFTQVRISRGSQTASFLTTQVELGRLLTIETNARGQQNAKTGENPTRPNEPPDYGKDCHGTGAPC